MNKIRLLFLIVVAFVFICGLLVFNQFQSQQGPRLGKTSPFFISRVSGNGTAYISGQPIEAGDFSSASAVAVKTMEYPKEVYLRTDNHTGVEFYFHGTRFVVFPETYVLCRTTGSKVALLSGSLEWHVEFEKKPVTVTFREPGSSMSLSRSGRVTIGDKIFEVRDYEGKLDLLYGETKTRLSTNQLFSIGNRGKTRIETVLPRPEWINPSDKQFHLKEPNDSIVHLKWKEVRGAETYRVLVYPSPLREAVLKERIADDNKLVIDVLAFEERNLCWQVIPMAEGTGREGMPSEIGTLNVTDALLEVKDVNKPPDLEVRILSRSGNTVFLGGSSARENKVYIDGKLVKRNMDGSFQDSVSYPTIGNKTIIVRAVSPTEIVTVKELPVKIWDE